MLLERGGTSNVSCSTKKMLGCVLLAVTVISLSSVFSKSTISRCVLPSSIWKVSSLISGMGSTMTLMR